MTRRRRLVIWASASVCLVLGLSLWLRHLQTNHVVTVDGVAVAVEGRDLWPFDIGDETGVGFYGKLGLVADRCLGVLPDLAYVEAFRRKFPDKPIPAVLETPIVIVWPAGVDLSGSRENLRIKSQGNTVHLGEVIEGGNTWGHDLSGIREELPRACRNARLVRVGLDE